MVNDDNIDWTCLVCGFGIADGAGYLGVDPNGAVQVMEERGTWRDAHPHGSTLGEIASLPEATQWAVIHTACDTDDAYEYSIDIHRVRTYRGLCSWTAHLLEKSWISGTNWRQVLLRAAGGV